MKSNLTTIWQKYNQKHSSEGFTVIELMVVFIIIVLLSSVIIINWNNQTPGRSLTIAQNEVVTNLRRVQSYSVNSRNINSSVPAKFYFLKFQKNQSVYSVDASDSATNPVYYTSLETFNLPTGVIVSNIALTSTDGGSNLSPDCLMVAVSVVYGKTYFLSNVCDSSALSIVNSPASVAPRANYNLTLTLQHPQKNISKTVTVYGLTNKVEAN
jgi:type II secretory pathway pseudopilin PulG